MNVLLSRAVPLGLFLACAAFGIGGALADVDGATQLPERGEAELAWFTPTTRTDQSCLRELEGFVIRWGRDPDALNQQREVPMSELDCEPTGRETECGEVWHCQHTVKGLSPGEWYFTVEAYDSGRRYSEPAGPVSKTITAP